MKQEPKAAFLDCHMRLRLADLDPETFERFFLHFLNAGITLEIERGGARVERRVIEANTYAAGSGRSQEGVDLIAKVEGGETWAFQCKRHKKWSPAQTEAAIAKAAGFPAQHYFLLVACDPHEGVQKVIAKYPNWSFWNLDRICAEFRLRVPKSKQPPVLHFLRPEELQRFAPYATDTFISPADYFASLNRAVHSFHHRYTLVGRSREMGQLDAFASGPNKVLLLSAKGGDGKSRLLWEFAESYAKKNPKTEVAFLNPHSSGSVPLALWDKETPRLLLVDDAHRLERVSNDLLTCVREGTASKLILATRPQGNEALEERLREHGLLDGSSRISLSALKKKDIRQLAVEALGPKLSSHIDTLLARTGDSPFLTALAGDLLQRGQLSWDNWSSDREFRAAVFLSFEKDNLGHLAADDQKHGARLLRVIALLAPVTPDGVFLANSAAVLDISRVDAEALLQRLQAAGVVSGESRNVRVIPDLFSDFLVFDTAFDPHRRLPELARTVLASFADQSAALLRNLAEASWIAGTESINRDDLLRPLLDAEFVRFDGLGFFERSQMLQQWAGFSVYLPAESLALAKKALEETSAPPGPMDALSPHSGGVNTYAYLRSYIPGLLKPIAKWHDDYRHEALDLLWGLGRETSKGMLNANRGHPWEVIADVMKFEPIKPIHVVESCLDWVAALVRRPAVRQALESPTPILSTLLNPCFERHVEFSAWEGRTVRWWTQPVDVKRTAHLRERAREILAWVIEHGSWLAALDAVGALNQALRRTAGIDTSRVANRVKFVDEWRPERLKALALLPEALRLHPHPLVRFAIRRLLWGDLAYEEDAQFAKAARAVVTSISDDLDLQLAIVLNSQGHYEFVDEIGPPKGAEVHDKIEQLWEKKMRTTAQEFIRAFPEPAAGVKGLGQLVTDFLAAGYTPNFGRFFPTIAKLDQAYAIQLAEVLLDPACHARLADSWYCLLYGFPPEADALVRTLLHRAKQHPRSEVRTGIIQYLRFRSRGDPGLGDDEKALIEELAARAGPAEIVMLIELVQWVNDASAPWAFALLEKLPLEQVAAQAYGELLEALHPYQARKTPPPLSTVQHVLNAMLLVPEIDLDHHGREFDRISELYPKAIYDFVLQRLAQQERDSDGLGYQPLPKAIFLRFRLPGIEKTLEFPAICEFLWSKLTGPLPDNTSHAWVELFQSVVLDKTEFWRPRLIDKIDHAKDADVLHDLVRLIRFDGSLVVFRFPEIATSFLRRAEDLGGAEGLKRMRSSLYVASGPGSRSFTNGELDGKQDYLEAEAAKAATQYAGDPILGPFYRWIVEIEQHERTMHKSRYEADIASLDE